ncbi:DNA-binding transcriptional regulator Fis [Kangiella sp. HZ709]|uniref:DNA-binding transcriptional regulator Fis n=1 Tax=Kangiella sp. HZ709 TaxID=2666328 RepID=UPI00351AE354
MFDNNQTQESISGSNFNPNPTTSATLKEHVAISMQNYIKQMNGQSLNDVYDLVLTQVEEPLLRAIMEHTRNNQTKAAQVLGLNRGTLRKKLKRYNLL